MLECFFMRMFAKKTDEYFHERIDWELHVPFHARFTNGLATLFLFLSWLPLVLVFKFQAWSIWTIAAFLFVAEMVIIHADNKFFIKHLDLKNYIFIEKCIYLKLALSSVYLGLFIYFLRY